VEGKNLVHVKDTIKTPSVESLPLESNRPSKTDVVNPEFISDDDGIPYCKTQTDYNKIVALNLKERYPNEFEKMLTCFRCEHYQKDNCFFPKSEIDKIEKDRQDNTIHCMFCGTKIHRLFSILMSYYYKDKHKVNIPIICCSCYAALGNNSFIKNTQRRIILFAVSFITSLIFVFTYFQTMISYSRVEMLLFLLPFLFWAYISTKDARNLYFLWKGKKYYQEVFGNALDTPMEEKSSKDTDAPEHPSDSESSSSGAYDSPGYEY